MSLPHPTPVWAATAANTPRWRWPRSTKRAATRGVGPLAMDSALEQIARTHLGGMAQARRFRTEAKLALNAASRAALNAYRQALALTAAGISAPEQAAAQWTEGQGSEQLLDRVLRAAGIAYTFVEEDDFRHYWLLVVGG